MQTIRVPNYASVNLKESSVLDADILAGATGPVLAYTTGMAANDYLHIGRLGAETGEITTITSVTNSTTLVTAALVKDHSRFDEAHTLVGNKVRIYRAANVDGTVPADASFSLLATTDIDADQNYTDYTDSAGDNTYWYKYTYYNSTSTAETPIADAIAVRGGGYGDYASIESIRVEAGLQNNKYITDALVNEKRQAAQAIINGQLAGLYTLPFTVPINPHIAQITRSLAAGMLLTNDYGTVSTFSTNNGKAKLDWAYEQLRKLQAREIVLTDNAGSDTSSSTTSGLQMWPNTTTADADASVGGGERMFRVSDRY